MFNMITFLLTRQTTQKTALFTWIDRINCYLCNRMSSVNVNKHHHHLVFPR